MSDKIYYHKHRCPCCERIYECVMAACEYRDGLEETCSRCWMVGTRLAKPENVHKVVTYAERLP
jgi:hypothetical protein